jgi:hypothetical protein
MNEAIASAYEQGKEIATAVPMIAQDLQGPDGSTIYKRFFDMVLLSLANRNRVSRETSRRLIHRTAIFNASEGNDRLDIEMEEDAEE